MEDGLSNKAEATSNPQTEDADIQTGLEDKKQDDDPTPENIVDWDGPKDPHNPLNWSSSRKVIMIGLVSFITFLSYELPPTPSTNVACADE